jgi:hypothetical protein
VHLDPIRKILIGSKYDKLQYWPMPAFEEVVKRSRGLTVDEMNRLRYERLPELCTAREFFLKDYDFEPSELTLCKAFYHA